LLVDASTPLLLLGSGGRGLVIKPTGRGVSPSQRLSVVQQRKLELRRQDPLLAAVLCIQDAYRRHW
jgi:hypothetical protein